MIVGVELARILDSLYADRQSPLEIIETGCVRALNPDSPEGDGWSTFYIAGWASNHPDCRFTSYELNPRHIETASKLLRDTSLHPFVHFVEGDSVAMLGTAGHVDFAYLDTSDDLEHGLAEFQICEAKDARMIVMDDRETKCLLALKYAKESGRWEIEEQSRLTVFRRIPLEV